jgi:hypothetical protein
MVADADAAFVADGTIQVPGRALVLTAART